VAARGLGARPFRRPVELPGGVLSSSPPAGALDGAQMKPRFRVVASPGLRRPDSAPVIPNGRGRFWTEHDWDNWRSRTFRSAAKAAGLPAGKDDGPARVRPRDLRSSFATLLIYEGQPPQYVADQLGNSPGTLLRDYARVWEDFDPSQRFSAETQIEGVRARLRRAAPTRTSAPQQRPRRARRRQRVSQVFHDASADTAGDHESPGNPRSPLSDSNRRPLPYHGSALPTELRGQKACKSTSSSRQSPGRARLPHCRGTAHGVRKRCGQRVHAGLSVDGTAPGQRSLWRTRFLLAVVVSRCMEERCRGGRRMPSCRATPRHLLGSSRELLVTGGPSGGGA
jgi:hypothetical protein